MSLEAVSGILQRWVGAGGGLVKCIPLLLCLPSDLRVLELTLTVGYLGAELTQTAASLLCGLRLCHLLPLLVPVTLPGQGKHGP